MPGIQRPIGVSQRSRSIQCLSFETYHGSNPFSGMNRAMEEDRGLGVFAPTSPNVYTRESSSLDRCTRGDDLGIPREASLKITQKLEVVSIAVVRGEICFARDCIES